MGSYEDLGLTPIINASGTVTRLGGALMPQPVLDAFLDAARESVPLDALQAAASRVIAEVTGAEAGLVTAGAASGLTLGAAAILAGGDAGRMERLPKTDDMPNEFVVAREQRSGYDHAVRAAGAVLIEVGFNEIVANAGVRRTEAWEYEAAFGPRTAGVLYAYGPNARPPLQEVVAAAHQQGIPVLLDAAGELPPKANLRTLPGSGADLVVFSGGKAMRGPQSTGILCGRADLITSAAVQLLDMDDHPELWQPPANFIDKRQLKGMPRHGIGRGFKVSKEEIVALLTALRLFASGAYDQEIGAYGQRLHGIADALDDLPVHAAVRAGADPEGFPLLDIALDEQVLGRTAFDVCRALRAGMPPVFVSHARLTDGALVIHPINLSDEAIVTLVRRLREELAPA